MDKRSANSEASANKKRLQLGSNAGGQGRITGDKPLPVLVLHVTLPSVGNRFASLLFIFNILFTKYVEPRQHKGIQLSVVVYRKKT